MKLIKLITFFYSLSLSSLFAVGTDDIQNEIKQLEDLINTIQTENPNLKNNLIFNKNLSTFNVAYKTYLENYVIISTEMEKINNEHEGESTVLTEYMQDYITKSFEQLKNYYFSNIEPFIKIEFQKKIDTEYSQILLPTLPKDKLLYEIKNTASFVLKSKKAYLNKLILQRNNFSNKTKENANNLSSDKIKDVGLWGLQDLILFSILEEQITKTQVEITLIENGVKNDLKDTSKAKLDMLQEVYETLIVEQRSIRNSEQILAKVFFKYLAPFGISTVRVFLAIGMVDMIHTLTAGVMLRKEDGQGYELTKKRDVLRRFYVNNVDYKSAYPNWAGFAAFSITSNTITTGVTKFVSNFKSFPNGIHIKKFGTYALSAISMTIAMKVMHYVDEYLLLEWERNSDNPEISEKANAVLRANRAISTGDLVAYIETAISFLISTVIVDLFWSKDPKSELSLKALKDFKNKLKNAKCIDSYNELLKLLPQSKKSILNFLKNAGLSLSRELLIFFSQTIISSWGTSQIIISEEGRKTEANMACLHQNLINTILASLITDLLAVSYFPDRMPGEIRGVFNKFRESNLLQRYEVFQTLETIYRVKNDEFVNCLMKRPKNQNTPIANFMFNQKLDKNKPDICKELQFDIKEDDPYKDSILCLHALISSDIKSPFFYLDQGIKTNNPKLILEAVNVIDEYNYEALISSNLKLREQQNVDTLINSINSPSDSVLYKKNNVSSLAEQHIDFDADKLKRDDYRLALFGLLANEAFYRDSIKNNIADLFAKIDDTNFYNKIQILLKEPELKNNKPNFKILFQTYFNIIKNDITSEENNLKIDALTNDSSITMQINLFNRKAKTPSSYYKKSYLFFLNIGYIRYYYSKKYTLPIIISEMNTAFNSFSKSNQSSFLSLYVLSEIINSSITEADTNNVLQK